MKIISVKFENVLGVKEFALDLGQITEISGRNAEGKTSILSALLNVIGGGSLSDIRNVKSEEPARIQMHLRDGDGINYVVDKTEKSLKLKRQVGDTAAFETIGKPQSFLNNLRDCKLQNPIDFLTCKDKDRVDLILQAVDLPFDSNELWSRVGFDKKQFDAVPEGMNPLNEIAAVRRVVFEKRTGVNTSRRDKRAACEEARLSVPAEIPTINGIEEKEKELTELKIRRQELKGMADNKLSEQIKNAEYRKEKITSEHDSEVEKIVAGYNAGIEIEIARLREKMREKIEAEKMTISVEKAEKMTKIDKQISGAQLTHSEDMAAIEELQPEIEKMSAEVATLREQEKSAVRIATIHEQANRMEREADELDLLAIKLTESMIRIDEYKAGLSKNLPISGLDISNNAVTIDGVPWDQLNTASKIIAAVEIIAARAQRYDFKFCVVDNAESLDTETRKLLIETLLANDIQAVTATVKDTDLEIKK